MSRCTVPTEIIGEWLQRRLEIVVVLDEQTLHRVGALGPPHVHPFDVLDVVFQGRVELHLAGRLLARLLELRPGPGSSPLPGAHPFAHVEHSSRHPQRVGRQIREHHRGAFGQLWSNEQGERYTIYVCMIYYWNY